MEITFLRHGESVGNAEGYHQGQMEFPLTDLGREQAEKLAERWLEEGVSFDRIISSPLLRTKETAEIIQSALNIPLSFDNVWMERHNGMLAGLKRNESVNTHPEPPFKTLFTPVGGTGESEWMLYLRAARGFHSLMDLPDRKYLIVSHGGTMNQLMHVVLGIAPVANQQGANFPHYNTAFTQIHYDKDKQQTKLLNANDHAHLDEKPIKDEHILTIVRHAQSVGNVEGRFQGQKDFPLTELGKRQATAVAERLAQEYDNYIGILASPQSRAFETAEAIGKAINLKVETNDLLKEIDLGNYSGLRREEIKEISNGGMIWNNPFQKIGEVGESWWTLEMRTGLFLQNIMERPAGHYILVSHGGTLNGLLDNILGILLVPNGHSPYPAFQNTNVTRVSYQKDTNRWRLWKHGDIQHLKGLEI